MYQWLRVFFWPFTQATRSVLGNLDVKSYKGQYCKIARYLAGLWVVEDMYGAWFDAVGLDSLVEGKTAPPPSTISIGEGSIVPVYE